MGVWGYAPTKRGAGRSPASIEGGWVGRSRAQRVLIRDGAWGCAPTPDAYGTSYEPCCATIALASSPTLGSAAWKASSSSEAATFG